MFETKDQPLAPTQVFLLRLIKGLLVSLIVVFIAIGIGMFGFHHFEKLTWLEAFTNSAMILSDMGLVSPLATNSGKIFASFYALFSGLAFVTIIGVIIAPIVHRFMHEFHIGTAQPPK